MVNKIGDSISKLVDRIAKAKLASLEVEFVETLLVPEIKVLQTSRTDDQPET